MRVNAVKSAMTSHELTKCACKHVSDMSDTCIFTDVLSQSLCDGSHGRVVAQGKMMKIITSERKAEVQASRAMTTGATSIGNGGGCISMPSMGIEE